ncbi:MULTISPECIES: sodium:calcium antiporter [unclassified Haloferax]|uniref:sodium:calcium antiporter n=1 Tax=Haloferax TaxID=2251 RepID=UPI0002B20B1E|nr:MULTISPECIES: Na+/Ca+ antiporter, CaCA family protein [unclassified Haloferax]ELZ55306.1 Na+/Ca+ antiporter, CaCA family protein [Haloferax sp. ATCC BAA-646]ELZ66563.1 Na+/Ca+ antiporter, CaCA family protein [Haloferax sp. ATCC BAA-645]ELZ66752.1 Na+/Ca+ antiporter, CaCA family protein [Haloferax sp. ATCC BAA-644]
MLRGGPVVQIGVILVSVLGLWVGARLLVDAAVRSARRFGLSELTIGLTIVAIGTSTPELSVAVDAAYKGLGDIAVANVLGSNIYNVAFVLGVISLFRVIPVAESLVSRDGVALLASTLLGGLVLFDLRVTRLEGVLLVGAFVAYTAYLLRSSQTEADGATEQSADQSLGDGGVTRPITDRIDFPGRDAVFLAGGLALVLVSGDYMVLAASELARGAGVSEWVIGGTIVAAGTSTPEFAVSLVALRQRSLGVSVGNVVGSNILNITGIVGVAAVASPLAVSASALGTFAWLVVVTLLIVAALWTGRVFSRVEGAFFATSEVTRWILGLI